MNIFRLISLIMVLAALCTAPASKAQSAPQETPRAPSAINQSDINDAPITLDGKPPEKATNSQPLPTKVLAPKADTPKSAPKTKDAIPPSGAKPAIVPFYATTAEYLNARGDSASTMVLRYTVNTKDLETPSTIVSKNIDLILGQDFAAIKTGVSMRIYDFKLNRLLLVTTPGDKPDQTPIFENTSLYAQAFRNIVTARQASQNGTRASVLVAPQTNLDVFWIDSAMGYATRDVQSDLSIKQDTRSLTARYKDEVIANLRASETPYLSDEYKNAFFALAHYEIPLHPLILMSLYTFDAPPKSMSFTLYNPGYPQGKTQVWTLDEAQASAAGFPLPKTAQSISEQTPISPLIFVITEAAHNRALQGQADKSTLAQEYDRAFLGGHYLIAWELGNRYEAYFGACPNEAMQAICTYKTAIQDISETLLADSEREEDQTLIAYKNATTALTNKATRIQGLQAYMTLDNQQSIPAFVERTAALARAKIKTPAAKSAGIETLEPKNMLIEALIKDPYDPNTYLGLAQLLALEGAYEHSWDLYDAMRAHFDSREDLAIKINRLEQKLENTAPAFFGPNTQ